MASVLLQAVTREYPGGVRAVDGLDLEIRDQEFLVIVGPSGCGKSTTLRMIAGLEEISAGEIFIDGRPVSGVLPKDRDLAMVFQNYALYPHMSVYRNMAFSLRLRYRTGWLRRLFLWVVRPSEARRVSARLEEIDRQVRQVAEMLGISPLLERRPRELSGGERQRVALGRALVREPAAFLFDEPLSNLDARLRVQMRRELKQLHQTLRRTMVYVTHDQIEAMTLGDRIAVMHGGRLQQLGKPLEVYDRPRNAFVAGFIGSPAMNFLSGTPQPTGSGDALQFRTRLGTVSVDNTQGETLQPYVGRRLQLGIRPEDVRLVGSHENETRPNVWSMRVTIEEPVGDATIVHLAPVTAEADPHGSRESGSPEETLLVARWAARTGVAVGDVLDVELDMSRAHFFHPETGVNVSLREESHEGN